jgi:penicillin G amidase
VVIVELDPNDSKRYMTPEGSQPFDSVNEIIKVRGGNDVIITVETTIWGPILQKDHRGRPLACRWVAYDTEGVNLGLLELETCTSLEESLDIANRSGTPHQNFVVADDQGRIAWTMMGRIPRRMGHDGFVPRSWRDGTCRWDGYLTQADYPRVVDPEEGRIWTANARVVGDEFYKVVGDSGYDRGARQMQIRDSLRALEKPDEADMLALQLDHRALFLEPWRKLLVDVLKEGAEGSIANRHDLLAKVEAWDGRATADSFGYRFVWAFRNQVISAMGRFLGRIGTNEDKSFSLVRHRRIEEPFWRILEERPVHYLDPEYESWDQFLTSRVNEVIKEATTEGRSLDTFVWGEVNTTKIQHPLSMAIPTLSRWLDMPRKPLSGAWSDLPKIQGVSSGASQRMAVSPGHEDDGYMHMPCGQSGHPLSPHYSDGHGDWEEGKPSSFLPGEPQQTLTLRPKPK